MYLALFNQRISSKEPGATTEHAAGNAKLQAKMGKLIAEVKILKK